MIAYANVGGDLLGLVVDVASGTTARVGTILALSMRSRSSSGGGDGGFVAHVRSK
jgi:hypothetical protein